MVLVSSASTSLARADTLPILHEADQILVCLKQTEPSLCFLVLAWKTAQNLARGFLKTRMSK